MDFSKGSRLYGFTVNRSRFSEELDGTLVEMTHDKTGAQLCWMDNKLENKVFSIAFKTIPTDSTGVFHILEHSVLCGSEKYPVREPFVELIKSSLNTFLNALTFQDMTMYPVASRNNRDLMNLTEVYLDAVFAPRILTNQNIFRQEGWHIEKDDEGNYIYKGVVFNEMKGAMGQVEQQVDRTLLHMLFPDTGYGHNSGGEPSMIPSLTYEQFIAAYKKYYHPSNARIWLDGDVPMDEMLPLIAGYLDRYDRSGEEIVLGMQEPVASEKTISFEIGQDEDPTDKGRLAVGKIIGSWQDKTRNMAAGILGTILTSGNESPLKKAILDRELAQDISMGVEGSIAQSYLCINVDNITDGKEQEVMDTIREVAVEQVEKGIDRDALEASLNRLAFRLREEDEPSGLDRCIRAMESWLYGGDPMFSLEVDNDVRELRAMIDHGDFDVLLKELLLNEDNRAILHAVPSFTVGDEKRADEKARLEAITSSWTEAEIQENAAMVASLDQWQKAPDSADALATLPMLNIADADQEPEWTGTELSEQNGIRIMLHRIPCHGIVHVNLYFALTDVTLPELTRLSLMTAMLGSLPTADHDVLRLEQDIDKYTGRMDFNIQIRGKDADSSTCAPCLVVSLSVLEENLEQALKLVTEILLTTRFDEKDKVRELLMQCEMSGRQRGAAAGHRIAMLDSLSHWSAEYAAREALDGGSSIRWVHAFATDFDAHYSDFVELMKSVSSRLFCRSRLTVGMTAQDEHDLSTLLSALPEGTPVPTTVTYKADGPEKRGYRIPAQIGFVSRGYRLDQCNKEFSGSMWITANILSLSYLWNKVRVQGGAYGTGFQIDRFGNLFTYSYRDPTPARSLSVDEGFAGFLKEFAEGDESLEKFIISSLNIVNPLMSPREKGNAADAWFTSGYTREVAERLRQEILHTTMEDVLDCAGWLTDFANKGTVCVVAHQGALDECDGLDIVDL